MDGHICDPEVVYHKEPETGDVAESIQRIINIFTFVLIFSVAPLLIITPFVVDTLDTLNRKIIAMISLSDVTNAIFTLTMAARVDSYEHAGDDLIVECTFVTFMQNAAPNWSILWSFALLFGIWLSLIDRFRPRKRLIFTVCNLIVWPLGIFVVLLIYLPYLHRWEINYNVSYLATRGCQSNFRFIYSHNGTRCLADEKARIALSSMYYVMLAFIVATQVIFVCIYVRLHRVWKGFQSQANTSSPSSAGYAVAARHSRETVLSSIQFSITGFIYIMGYSPLIIKQLLEMYYGPPVQNKTIVLALTVYFLTVDNVVGVMNVLFYGVLSSKFRREVWNLFKSLWNKLTLFCTRFPISNRRTSSSISIQNTEQVTAAILTDFETDSDYD